MYRRRTAGGLQPGVVERVHAGEGYRVEPCGQLRVMVSSRFSSVLADHGLGGQFAGAQGIVRAANRRAAISFLAAVGIGRIARTMRAAAQRVSSKMASSVGGGRGPWPGGTRRRRASAAVGASFRTCVRARCAGGLECCMSFSSASACNGVLVRSRRTGARFSRSARRRSS